MRAVDQRGRALLEGLRRRVMAEIGRLGSPHKISALAAGQTMTLASEPTRAYG